LSETNSQRLSFSASGSLKAEDDPVTGTSTGFADPSVRLNYSRATSDAAFDVSAFYREADVNNTIFDDLLRPEDLIADPGTLRTYGGDVELSYGLASPLGFTIYAGTTIREYQDTIDPDLSDNTSDRYGASLNFRFSPVTQVGLNADWTEYRDEGIDAFDRTEASYSVSLSHELRNDLRLTGSLGYTDGETTEIGEDPTYDEQFASLGLRQGVANGAYTAGLSFLERSNQSDRVSLDLGREMELPAGALSFGMGLTQTDSSDLELLGSLDWTQELPQGVISVFFDQSITSNSDNEDTLLSRLSVDYQHQINSVSSFTLAMDLSRTKDAGSGRIDTIDGRTRANFAAIYSHELTQDWNLNMGYERRQYDEVGGDKAESDSVFLTLTRGFSIGF
jgi:hypothetical protein